MAGVWLVLSIAIYGAGLLGRQMAALVLSHCGDAIHIEGFHDDTRAPGEPVLDNLTTLGGIDRAPADRSILFAIGYRDLAARCAALERVRRSGRPLVGFVHPNAHVEMDVDVERGAVILGGAAIDTGARVEAGAFVDIGVCVCERAVVGTASYLSAGSVVGGNTVLGPGTFLGLNATVTDGLSIGPRSRIQAGTLVHQDLPAGCTVMEARTIRAIEPEPATTGLTLHTGTG